MSKTNLKLNEEYKTCSICGEWLPKTIEYFAVRSDNGNFIGKCRECSKKIRRDNYKLNPEYAKKCGASYYNKHKDKINIRIKLDRKSNPDKYREYEVTKYNKNKDIIKDRAIAYYWKNREQVLKYKKKWRDENCTGDFNEKHYKKYRDTIIKNNKIYGQNPVLFETYAYQLTIEECSKSDKDGLLLAKCTYCGHYFYPTRTEISNRVKALKGQKIGESRLYCSQGCKDSCSIYGKEKWPEGYGKKRNTEVVPELRQLALERDDYECQRCGKHINDVALYIHHIHGATQNKMIANDLWNVITFCEDCHSWIHSQEGCKYHDLKCS